MRTCTNPCVRYLIHQPFVSCCNDATAKRRNSWLALATFGCWRAIVCARRIVGIVPASAADLLPKQWCWPTPSISWKCVTFLSLVGPFRVPSETRAERTGQNDHQRQFHAFGYWCKLIMEAINSIILVISLSKIRLKNLKKMKLATIKRRSSRVLRLAECSPLQSSLTIETVWGTGRYRYTGARGRYNFELCSPGRASCVSSFIERAIGRKCWVCGSTWPSNLATRDAATSAD